ncbi:hypothetical protein Vadar_002009 [Vaccinium darrowii]|uniref:Uncharacterized protein n=1 Tax=Vaccinium darrowii TaxID=229202 RepID=A0ACB7Z0R6_9ERIC|nr:hypothetical protein Vadar_002009 [Vaccinium darrowii]
MTTLWHHHCQSSSSLQRLHCRRPPSQHCKCMIIWEPSPGCRDHLCSHSQIHLGMHLLELVQGSSVD